MMLLLCKDYAYVPEFRLTLSVKATSIVFISIYIIWVVGIRDVCIIACFDIVQNIYLHDIVYVQISRLFNPPRFLHLGCLD